MDDPPAVGSAGFQRRERERAEAKREADAAAKAKAVLEKRLQEAQADLFTHAGSGAEAGKQHELDRLRGEISDQIKRDVEKAKREAEAEREFRKADAVISHKLYEKEEAAKRRVVEAKRAARVERRLERQDDDFKETFAELNEAEAARAKRARQREEAKKDAASKEKEKEKRTLSAAEKGALRAEHIKAAAERAARAEAAKEAEKAARAEAAARRADGAAAGMSKPSRDENNKPVVLSRSRVPANAVEWKLRRSALEGLAQILGSETRCTPEGVRRGRELPTSKAPLSADVHSFRLTLGRAIVSRNGLEARALCFERASATAHLFPSQASAARSTRPCPSVWPTTSPSSAPRASRSTTSPSPTRRRSSSARPARWTCTRSSTTRSSARATTAPRRRRGARWTRR